MKNNPYEHILTPDKIPNSLDRDLDKEDQTHSLSLLEFSRQNKDLMARLSVQLRRNSELEMQIKRLGERILALKNQNEELSNNSLKNRELLKINEAEMRDLREQLKQTEIELGQTSLLYQNLERTHEQGLDKTDIQLRRYIRYQARIKKWVRPLINKLSRQNYAILNQLNDYKQTSSIQKEQLSHEKNLRENQQNKHKSSLNKAADLQDEIIMTYESELKQVQQLLDQRDVELKDSEDRRRYLEKIRDKYVVMENRCIAAERMRFELERTYDEKVGELRREIINLNEEYKSNEKDFQASKKLLEIIKQDNEELTNKYINSASLASGAKGQNQADFVMIGELKASKKSLEKQLDEMKSQVYSYKEENKALRQELDLKNNPPKIPETIPRETSKEATKPKANKKELLSIKNTKHLHTEWQLEDLAFEEFNEIDRLIKEIEFGYPIKNNNEPKTGL